MADQPTLFKDIASLLETLPQAQLVEMTRRAALDGLQAICRRELGNRTLEDIVAAVFPDFSPARVAEVARQVGITAIKNACWKSIMDIPGSWRVSMRTPDREATLALRALQGPAILVYWHFGPVNMIIFAFRHIGVPALVVTRSAPNRWASSEEIRKLRVVVSEGNPAQSVAALRRSRAHLKEGGKVGLAIDGSMGCRDLTIPFLGRRFSIGRGAAGLARLTGAPLIPCTMQWDPTDWSMAFRVFDALPTPLPPPQDAAAFEQALMESAARCFEDFGRQHPGQFTIDQLAAIADAPKIV